MSSRVNTDAGRDQHIKTREPTHRGSSAAHCESSSNNILMESVSKGSNAQDSEKACCDCAGTGSDSGCKGKTLDNRQKACSKRASESTAAGKGETRENKEEACLKCATDSTTEGKGGKGDNRVKARSKCTVDSTAARKRGTQHNGVKAFSICASDSTERGRDGTEDHKCAECSKCATDPTAKEKGETQENTEKECSKCASESNVGCKGGTTDKGEMACTKSATDSTAGRKCGSEVSRNKACSKCAANSAAGVEDGAQEKPASRKHSETADGVPIVTARHQGAEMPVTKPDVPRESMSDSDVTMASVSDTDVNMQSASKTHAAVIPMSASLICLNCHSHLGIEISGVATFRPAQTAAAINLPPLAQAPQGASAQPQGFSVPNPYSVPHQTFGATTSSQQQPFMAPPPPYTTQVPWEAHMCHMHPSVQRQPPVNAWSPNSAQVPPSFQMPGFVGGTQHPPSPAAPSFTAQATYHMQVNGYPPSSQLHPSMMAAPSPFPAAHIPQVPTPGPFPPPYRMAAPPYVQPPLNAQMFNFSAGRQPQYSWPPAGGAHFSPNIFGGNVNGQPQTPMTVPQMPPGMGIPGSAYFQPGTL